MPVPTSVARAIDVDLIVDGARVALLASSAVTTITNRIVPEIAKQGTAAPYVVLSLASVVFRSAYQDPTISALLDVSCYGTTGSDDASWSTATVRALALACLAALVDTPWTVAGMIVQAATMEPVDGGTGFRNISEEHDGTMTRGRQFTMRVIASKA